MKNVLFVLPALAVMCLATSAQADSGAIDSATLSAMGLSGVQVVSDAEAMEVRGMGYSHGKKSSAKAFGISYAYLETGGGRYRSSLGNGSAGTLDGFLAKGSHYAGGEHLSEAVISKETVETKSVGGIKFKTTRKMTLGIGAGGSASSIAF